MARNGNVIFYTGKALKMDEPATFNEADWAGLTVSDKKALKILSDYGFSLGLEPLARAAGVGQKSMDSLISKELAIEGESGLHGRYFQLTDKGVLALEWIAGRRLRVYPSAASDKKPSRPRRNAKLPMIEPRLKPLEPRLKPK